MMLYGFMFNSISLMMTNSPDADVVGYNPPLSLWRLVEQHVSVNERDEIKNMLGGGVVDETQELHDELQTFLDIWRDCRQNGSMVRFWKISM